MTHADFLASIIADPDADEPRLVYADWLEENGQPERCEFIRVQIELAKMRERVLATASHPPIMRKIRDLRRRERELWNFGMPGTWVDSIKPLPDCIQCIDEETISHGSSYIPIFIYRRGCEDEVRCSWADWLAHHAAIRAAAPLREVTLTEWTDDDLIAHDFKVIVKNGKPTWTSARFPGIKFELLYPTGIDWWEHHQLPLNRSEVDASISL